MALPPALESVRSEFPADFFSTEADDLREYGKDWTKVYAPQPCAVALPRSADEVSRLLKLCNDARVAVVPSGGRTGLAGGAVASRGELVLSLQRMRQLGEIDEAGQTVRVEAGAITEAVHQHCEAQGLTWPVDFASKGSSQIGGNIATNAGGVKVIRYGLTRQWVLGLEVVLASGEKLDLNGALEKNNTGIDLRQLFIGSEGTLGVITAATLKLTRVPGNLDVMLFGLEDVASVLRLLSAARRGPFTVTAFELFTSRCLARVHQHRRLGEPLESTPPCYALVEVEDASEDTLEAWVSKLFDDDVVVDGTLARDGSQAKRLWEYREAISESLSATGLPHKNDVALPVERLPAFCSQLEQVFQERYPTTEVCLFGHIGDGNLHINVMKPDDQSKEAFLEKVHEADHAIFELVRAHRGSISAEHGIGLLKKPFLEYSRSPAELAIFRAVKHALDPKGILNPGKVFDS